jgi:predicted XRE-type DNA-binding protein
MEEYKMVESKDYEKSSGNVFEDLEFENSEQEFLKAELAHCVRKAIAEKKLTQSQAAALMGVSQSDISKLKHIQYYNFTAERLFIFLNSLGYDVDIHVYKAKNDKGQTRFQAS